MSIRRLRRELGIVIHCNGTGPFDDESTCNAKIQTANIRASANRWGAKQQGWSRGLRKGRKRRDLCPDCTKIEIAAHAEEQATAEQRKRDRDEMRLARLSGTAKPKKKRGAKGDGATASPSAECAPAPAS